MKFFADMANLGFPQDNTRIEFYIANLQKSVIELEKQSYYAAPEHQLDVAIDAQKMRIEALKKIKNQEPINKDEHDLLMKMKILKKDALIRDYFDNHNADRYIYCNIL